MRVLVLGGGVVGVTSAWYLARDGHEVTVVDRQPGPALETSFVVTVAVRPPATAVVTSGLPLKMILLPATKPLPFTVSVKSAGTVNDAFCTVDHPSEPDCTCSWMAKVPVPSGSGFSATKSMIFTTIELCADSSNGRSGFRCLRISPSAGANSATGSLSASYIPSHVVIAPPDAVTTRTRPTTTAGPRR